jgi:hypothetical protein
VVFGALLVAGCTFRDEARQMIDHDPAGKPRLPFGTAAYVCKTSPDVGYMFSTAPRDLAAAVRNSNLEGLKACSGKLSAWKWYFSDEIDNLIFEIDDCRITRAYTVADPGGALVQGSQAACGRPGEFRLDVRPDPVGHKLKYFYVIERNGGEW